MEWSKVKNIIILLLLLVNGFLLVLVGMRQERTDQYQRSALTQAVEVLEQNGIQVEEEKLSDVQGLVSQSVERSTQGEQDLVRTLLWEDAVRVDQGGGLYTYENSRGQVSIRPGGEISARMAAGGGWETQDPLSHAQQLLDNAGVKAELLEAQLEQGSGTVLFRQQWQAAPLFSSHILFAYQDGRLTGIEGTLLIQEQGQTSAVGDTGEAITLPTALLRFLDGVLTSGEVSTAIESMQAGYLASQSFSGSISLNPTWLIRSDTADYYLSAVTGELTRVSEG